MNNVKIYQNSIHLYIDSSMSSQFVKEAPTSSYVAHAKKTIIDDILTTFSVGRLLSKKNSGLINLFSSLFN